MSTEETHGGHSSMSDFELIYPRPGSQILVDQEPAGRSGHAMVSDDSNLYILGGYNPLGCVLNQGRPTVLEELWKFNMATEKWTKMESLGLPPTCASSCLVIRGTNLYVFGGTSYPFGQRVSNTVKVCDISKLKFTSLCSREREVKCKVYYTWYDLESYGNSSDDSPSRHDLTQDDENKPPKGYGQSLIFHDQYIYTYGGAVGFYNEAIGDLHRLNLETMTWEKLKPAGEEPEGRYKQEIIRDKDCFYMMGGGRLHEAQPVHILYRYTFANNTWTRLVTQPDPTFGSPKPRSAFAFAQVDRDVYICGGSLYGQNAQPHQVLQDIWHFSLDTFMWTQLPISLPERMYFHRAAVSPSRHLYVYGGVVMGGRRSPKMYSYRLPFQMAELKELCWARLCHLWKDLGKVSPTELVETYGIPRHFVERLA